MITPVQKPTPILTIALLTSTSMVAHIISSENQDGVQGLAIGASV